MNWYKVSQLNKVISQNVQEWWIGPTGKKIEADSDSLDGEGTYGHEDRVIEEAQKYVRSAMSGSSVFSDATSIFGEEGNYESYDPVASREYLSYWVNDALTEGIITENQADNIYDAIADETGVSKELVSIAVGSEDAQVARDYAMKNWHWIAVRGLNVEIQTLSSNDVDRLARGLYSIYGDDVDNLRFTIEVKANDRYLSNVPYEDILSGNLAIHSRKNSAFSYI